MIYLLFSIFCISKSLGGVLSNTFRLTADWFPFGEQDRNHLRYTNPWERTNYQKQCWKRLRRSAFLFLIGVGCFLGFLGHLTI